MIPRWLNEWSITNPLGELFQRGRPGNFERQGFTVVRGAFLRSEVMSMRAQIQTATDAARSAGAVFDAAVREASPKGDLLAWPGLEQVVFDDRILGAVREVVGRRELVYFGDSTIQVGEGARGFHKDNTNRTDATHPDWLSPYTLVRVGLYLQDHDWQSGGLKVRCGSHQYASNELGRIHDVRVRGGDITIWSLRTTHSGNAIKLRFLPRWFSISPRIEAHVPRILQRPPAATRMAIFITYGVEDDHLKRYLEKAQDPNGPAGYLHEMWLHAGRSERALEYAQRKGVKLLFPIPSYGSRSHHRPFET
jgi:hypothetical protein